MPAKQETLEATRSRVHGMESALAERAVILLDKLSRCTIHPYTLYGQSTAITQNSVTDLDDEFFRNDQDGPLLVTRLRMTTGALAAASVAATPPANLALMVADQEGHHRFARHPVMVPCLYAQDNGTWQLDQPYVLGPGASLLLQVQELNVGTGVMYASVQGEVVLGGITDTEIEEALLLGVYPLHGRQSAIWAYEATFARLWGNNPPRLKGKAADLLDGLRLLTAELRNKLASSRAVTYLLQTSTGNVGASATVRMSRDDLRNDQGGPMAIAKLRAWSILAPTNAATAVPLLDFSLDIESVNERIKLTRTPALLPTVVSLKTATWAFDHPHILGELSAVDVTLQELAADANYDVYISLLGEVVRGVSLQDLRQAVALGLYPIVGRYFE